MSTILRRALLLAIPLLLCASSFAPAYHSVAAAAANQRPARAVFVLISGGGTQLSNNYSQYLQARAIAAHFELYPQDTTWVFFGAGNTEGQAPVFSDVRRQTKKNGLVVDTWLPGTLPDNRPAKRAIIMKALREEILPTVRDGGTLYLFVGDHGHLSSGANPESVITLWTLEPHEASRRGWRSNREEALGVTDLRKALAEGLGRGRAVFVMTQCHSGGFHHLTVPRKLTPNPDWFMAVPESAAPQTTSVYPAAAGFTATDEQSLAAGCDPSPDPDSWSGYERYVPENLLGMDLFTLQSRAAALPSFAAAHEAATLVDQTIDKPLATSEQYLERWAELIETELDEPQNLTPAIRKLVADYNEAVDSGKLPASNAAALRERQATFAGFVERMTEQNPAVKPLLLSGKRRELETAVGPRSRGGDHQHHGGGASDELRRVWKEDLRPAWKAAVLAGEVTAIPPAALDFEKRLLASEDAGRDLMLGSNQDILASEVFWESGYNKPGTVDPAKAAAFAEWAAQRRFAIQDWAEQSRDDAVRKAGAKLAERGPRRLPETGIPARSLSRKTAAERTLFYRRVLAAWAFLVAADEKPALQRLEDVIALERTPLP